MEGLVAGADNYLVRTFAATELLARIHTPLRDSERGTDEPSLLYGELYLDPLMQQTVGERVFSLSPKAFGLLAYRLRRLRNGQPRERLLLDVGAMRWETRATS